MEPMEEVDSRKIADSECSSNSNSSTSHSSAPSFPLPVTVTALVFVICLTLSVFVRIGKLNTEIQQYKYNMVKSQQPIGINKKHSDLDMEINSLKDHITVLTDQISDGRDREHGSSYVHWGKTNCTEHMTFVYSGQATGTSASDLGGGVQYLCTPTTDMQWNKVDPKYELKKYAWLFRVYYYLGADSYNIPDNKFIFDYSYHLTPVACSVCYVQRASKMMIPGKRTCPDSSWTREYEGYLMSGHTNQRKDEQSPDKVNLYTYECVDQSPDYLLTSKNSASRDTSAFMLPVSVKCEASDALCSAYRSGREIACVVCTK